MVAGSILTSGSLGNNITPYGGNFILIETELEIWRNVYIFLPPLTSAFLEIMKLSIVHISAMFCSSHFFQASVGTSEAGDEFLYEGRYRRASGMAPLFRPGNTSKDTHFHPQIYESPPPSKPPPPPSFQTAMY